MVPMHSTLMRLLIVAVALSASMAAPPDAHAGELGAPAGMGYVTPDNAISIKGDDSMHGLLQRLDDSFTQRHPSFRFDLDLKGAATALPALTADVTALAPLARDAFAGERAAFKQAHGHDPATIRVGYVTTRAAAVVVNMNNNLGALTLTQVARIFTSGMPEGDINLWSQLDDSGVPTQCGQRRIHLYGLRDDGGATTYMRQSLLGNHPFAASYETFERPDDVVAAVGADLCGIGIVNAMSTAASPAGIRSVPLGATAQKPVSPTSAGVSSGEYPLVSYARFYVNRADGKPLEPWIKAYLSEALSDRGQAQIGSESGFRPLAPMDLQRERERLGRM